MAGKQRNNLNQRTLRELIKRQEYRCALSGLELTPEATALDHKLPVSRGGSHDLDNVWLVHTDVNRAKGTLTVEEFVAMCERVVAHYRGYAPASRPQPTTQGISADEQKQLSLFEEHEHE